MALKIDGVISILKMIPVIIGLVNGIEEFIPVSGAGKQKLALIKTVIEMICKEAEEIWPILEKIISGLVSIANEFGIFKKSTTAA